MNASMTAALVFAGLSAWPVWAEEGVEGSHFGPEAQLFELGFFGGSHFFPDDHGLFDEATRAHRPLAQAAPSVGARLGYYPLSWLGVEAEGAAIPVNLAASGGGTAWTARGQLLAQVPGKRFSPFILAGFGALGIASDSLGNNIDPALAWGVGAKFHAARQISFRADLRHLMSSAYDQGGGSGAFGTHHFEGLMSVSLVFGKAEPLPPDPDGDGFRGELDRCPNEAGVAPDGCPPPAKDSDGDGVTDDKDACPEIASSEPDGCPPKDSDGDGVPDKADECPNEAGKLANGCPDPDPDKDGVLGADDKCPTETGVPPTGCPIRDSDNDGVFDDHDQCAGEPETKNGFQDSDGCPDELPKAVKKFTGAIKGIKFPSGKAKIDPSSYPALNEAAKVLTEYGDLRIEISGHTDNVGSPETNRKLSQDRADAVRTYLLSKGIAEDRIVAVGFGPEQPIADNSKAAGRAENRRIEFKLLMP